MSYDSLLVVDNIIYWLGIIISISTRYVASERR
nr:MAG TPA: hypothetical protein [Bacteriophage sp.]